MIIISFIIIIIIIIIISHLEMVTTKIVTHFLSEIHEAIYFFEMPDQIPRRVQMLVADFIKKKTIPDVYIYFRILHITKKSC